MAGLVLAAAIAVHSGCGGGGSSGQTPPPSGEYQISQFGITWNFDRAYPSGQFANGDYWVVGPVTITGISPASTLSGGRTIHGSMINPSPRNENVQGYDSAMYANTYDAALNVARPDSRDLSADNPLVVPVHSSLVSTISIAEAEHRPQLQSAAILTVLPAAPEADSFRPPYCGTDKTMRHRVGDLDFSRLASLAPVSATPTLAEVERYFQRPWLDHIPGWSAGYEHPEENMPNYGREIATQIGIGALMLHLDFSEEEKRTLLLRYVQLGIDLYGIVRDGGTGNWAPDGGHASGRKWPIIFAGLLLNVDGMIHIGPGDGTGQAYFGEDAQTFYVAQEDVDRAHNPNEDCPLEEYAAGDLGLPEWGIRHATLPAADNQAWCAPYRQCCTAHAWPGFVLSALIMDAKTIWDHDALFDYQDRYLATEPPQQWMRCWDRFTEEMWDTYRAGYGSIWIP